MELSSAFEIWKLLAANYCGSGAPFQSFKSRLGQCCAAQYQNFGGEVYYFAMVGSSDWSRAVVCGLGISAISHSASAQDLRISDLSQPAQKFVLNSKASLSFVGFLKGGEEALFAANDGLLRQIDLRTGLLVRVLGGSARRDTDLRNWANTLPLEPYANRFQMYRVMVSPNGLHYSYTDATNVAWVVDTKTGDAIFGSQTGLGNGGMWWSSTGEFMSMPMTFVLPGDRETKEQPFCLVAFNPETRAIRIARPWSVTEDNAPNAYKTPRKRWMNGTWFYELPGGSFSVSNNRITAPIYGYFFSEEDASRDLAVELPFPVISPDEILVNKLSSSILINDRKGKKVWMTKPGQEKPVAVAEYTPKTEPGFDGSKTYVHWVGTDRFLLISISYKKHATRIESRISDWSLRKLSDTTVVISSVAPKWASTTMTFSPDGKWVIDSMYIRSFDTGKGWLVESNFAIHPSEAKLKVIELGPM